MSDRYREQHLAELAARIPRPSNAARFLVSRVAATSRPRVAIPEIRSVRNVCAGVAVVETDSFPLLVAVVAQAALERDFLELARENGLCGWLWEYLQDRAAAKPRLERNWQAGVTPAGNAPGSVSSQKTLEARRERVDRDFSHTSRLYEIWVEDVAPECSALALACPSFRAALKLSPSQLWAGMAQNEAVPPGLPVGVERQPYMAAFLAARPELGSLALPPSGPPLRLSALAGSLEAELSH